MLTLFLIFKGRSILLLEATQECEHHGYIRHIEEANQASRGKATVAGLASHGARVYIGTRSESKAIAAIQEIKSHYSNADLHFLPLDLSNFASVIEAAKTFRRYCISFHDDMTFTDQWDL
jgi:hypothetical protein